MESTTYAVVADSITGVHAMPTQTSPNIYGALEGITICGIQIDDVWYVTKPDSVTCVECKGK